MRKMGTLYDRELQYPAEGIEHDRTQDADKEPVSNVGNSRAERIDKNEGRGYNKRCPVENGRVYVREIFFTENDIEPGEKGGRKSHVEPHLKSIANRSPALPHLVS